MVHHLVFFRMKDSAGGHSAAENASELATRLNALNGAVPGLVRLTAGVNFLEGDGLFEVGLESVFEDRDGLEVYRVHPAHQAVVAFVKEVTSDRAAVDFDA